MRPKCLYCSVNLIPCKAYLRAGMICALVGVVCAPAAGQGPGINAAEVVASAPATAPSPRFDPQADQILHAWADQFRPVQRFRLNLHTKVRIRSEASNVENKSDYRLAVERPNKLALLPETQTSRASAEAAAQRTGNKLAPRPKKQASDPSLICDGSTLYSVLPILNRYTEVPAPKSFEDLATGSARVALTTGGSALVHIDMLLTDEPYDKLTALATQARYLGTETLAGTPCDHLLLTKRYLDLEVWIEAGPQRLLRQLTLRIPSASLPATLPAPTGTGLTPTPVQLPNMHMETTLTMSDWAINPVLPPETFRFRPPPDFRKVDNLLGGSVANLKSELANPLVGQPASSFAAPLLDGSVFDLSSFKGHVAVLDFWASWSAGSAERLPAHARLAHHYADRGVRFLAVNVEESERTIREFLAKSPLDLPIALDRSGSIAKLYRVLALPQTVVIGSDGRVQAVHGPVPANASNTLCEELDRLLAGPNPATQPKRQAAR